MIKILITSVGSLVGQNILDTLESRRKYVTIIGTNSIAENQRNFRCDTVYLVHPTAQLFYFEDEFDRIFKEEQPDFVFAGRDIDVIFLSRYKEKNPLCGERIPCGGSIIAQVMFDKYETFCFALKHNLPFADTFLLNDQVDNTGLNNFVKKHGFPLVVKPRFGFGSLNVFFLNDLNQLNILIEEKKEFLIQEYLDPNENFETYLKDYQRGMPLFFQLPDDKHYVSQIVFSSNHELLGLLSTRHILEGGKAILSELHKDEHVNQLINKYIELFGQLGWVGFLNIQYKPDRDGNWKVYEINPRMAGASSSRLLLGLDEIGLLINSISPESGFPVKSIKPNKRGVVLKYLKDHLLLKDDVSELTKNKVWNKQDYDD